MATYSIKDLEKISGVKAHTIRIWEKRYDLVHPNRTQTNIRYYTDADLRRLLNICILSRNGIKISKIALLGNEEIGEKVLLLNQKSGNTENQIESLIISMIELDENKFDRILSNLIIKHGFEVAFIKILFPFFERLGVLWQAGTILPSQEHFVSNLVRQKLIVAIDSYRDQAVTKNAKFLLFLPEGEMHELVLLFCQYLLRKRGFKSFYLGQSVPYSDLSIINATSEPDYILTMLFVSLPEKKVKDFVNTTSQIFQGKTIYISGHQMKQLSFELPSNFSLINQPLDFISHLDQLL
jgi:DNA-binding transcriptional MerR regulator